ncbi:MAG: hypothetical protein EOO10_13350 [Chitinophagaceae bacterium]|nr:MAG: hypothetical protein EOO10_13350 [Chitinophagaceae bacterium]
MQTIIEDIEQKIKTMKKYMEQTNSPAQKALFASSIANASQMVANFREMERILHSSGDETK